MNSTISSITPQELYRLRQQGQAIDLIDVRTAMEYHAGHVEGAVPIPLSQVTPEAVEAVRQGKGNEPVYVICHSGGRSQTACERLAAAGMRHVVNVTGGTAGWKRAGYPLVRQPGAWRQFVRPVGFGLFVLALALGVFVHPYFTVGAAAAWIGMIVAGGGCCPLSGSSGSSSPGGSGTCCTK